MPRAAKKVTAATKKVSEPALFLSLWSAVKIGNVNQARSAVKNGASAEILAVPIDSDVENVDEENWEESLKLVDIRGGEIETEHHVSVDENNELSDQVVFVTPLMIACASNDLAMIQFLVLEAFADVNTAQPTLTYSDGYSYGGLTNLMIAVDSCGPEVVSFLISQGADVNAILEGLPGYEGIRCKYFTPLLCSRGGDEEVGRLLLRAGADVNHVGNYSSSNQGGGRDHVCYWSGVVLSGDVRRAKEMIEENGADVDWPDNNDYDYGEDSYMDVGLGVTVLMTAVLGGDHAMVKLLLEKGADPNLHECVDLEELREQESELDELAEESWLATPLSVAVGRVLKCVEEVKTNGIKHYGKKSFGLVSERKSLGDCFPAASPSSDPPTSAKRAKTSPKSNNKKKGATSSSSSPPFVLPDAVADDPMVKLLLGAGAVADANNNVVPI